MQRRGKDLLRVLAMLLLLVITVFSTEALCEGGADDLSAYMNSPQATQAAEQAADKARKATARRKRAGERVDEFLETHSISRVVRNVADWIGVPTLHYHAGLEGVIYGHLFRKAMYHELVEGNWRRAVEDGLRTYRSNRNHVRYLEVALSKEEIPWAGGRPPAPVSRADRVLGGAADCGQRALDLLLGAD